MIQNSEKWSPDLRNDTARRARKPTPAQGYFLRFALRLP